MKTVILCGGKGTRIQDATNGLMPKPMLEIGGKPILWHIMKIYSSQGHNDFVLCLGHLGNVIKDYFLHYEAINSDFTLRLGSSSTIEFHRKHSETDWVITLADTGAAAMTGARLARVRSHVGDGTFLLTYGDGVADIDLESLVAFHHRHGRMATVTGVRPQGRFGRLNLENNTVLSFEEKPADENGYINGGFFVFEQSIFDYVDINSSCILEREPLENLARDGQLAVYRHGGFWQCMDTYRDMVFLEELWQGATPPWRSWDRGK